MSAPRAPLAALVEADELARDTRAWRHALATVAAILGVVPLSTRLVPSLPPALAHAGMALWSSFVIGWAVLAAHGFVLGRARRRLVQRLAAEAAHDERGR